MITVPKEKCPLFNGNEMIKEIGHIYQTKNSQPGHKISTTFRLL